jgi:hypothetical protein
MDECAEIVQAGPHPRGYCKKCKKVKE